MTDHDDDEPRDEVREFLRARAHADDSAAVPIDSDEAAHRVVAHHLEPRSRLVRTPAAVAHGARRRPAIAAAVIAALLIGSVAGFAAGRSSAPKHATVAARAAVPDDFTPTPVKGTSAALAYGSMGGSGAPGMTMTRLFIRTTSEGVALRGYLEDAGTGVVPNGPNQCDPSSWCPPPECSPSTFFTAELSSVEAVTQGGSPQYALGDKPAAMRGMTPLGQMEGAPVSSYIVQTSSAVTTVRGTWPDGFVDEMPPVNGWAIVAHSGSTPASTIDAILSDGSHAALDATGSYAMPAACQPPPPRPLELPPAGAEQPDDPDSARAAITTAYTTVFTHGSDPTVNAGYMEDAEYLQNLAAGVKQNFPEATDTVTVEVGEIRFLTKTDAALYFELKYQGGMLFGKQVGYAKLIDGTWKIARDTVCMTYQWGGATCDPPPDPQRSQTSPSNATTATTAGN